MKIIIPKKELDAAINADRKYYQGGGTLESTTASFEALEKVTHVARTTWSELLMEIFAYSGLKKNATNEDIYAVLQALDWEVSE